MSGGVVGGGSAFARQAWATDSFRIHPLPLALALGAAYLFVLPRTPSVLDAHQTFRMIEFGWSAALGTALGLAYALATHATHRLAYRFPARFTEIALGGLLGRLLFTLALLLVVLALVPLDRTGFVGGFAAMFLVGLVLEVALLARLR